MCPSAAFEAEVLRINGRFNAEIIEALSVCPYAAPARRAGSSVRRVVLGRTVSEDDLVRVALELEAITEPIVEVAQVILPQLTLDAKATLELGQRFGARNAQLAAEGRRAKRPVFVHAVFHPDLPYKVDTPAQLVPFFRRSPDPFVQLVRLSVLDDLHAKRPRGTQFFDGSPDDLARLLAEKPVKSITELISEDNRRAALEGGNLARIEAILADILRDRAVAYAAFDERSP
jgi:hypothetical protein